nr:MAG TPA: hypothetical protein [Crassvirales sp.]
MNTIIIFFSIFFSEIFFLFSFFLFSLFFSFFLTLFRGDLKKKNYI